MFNGCMIFYGCLYAPSLEPSGLDADTTYRVYSIIVPFDQQYPTTGAELSVSDLSGYTQLMGDTKGSDITRTLYFLDDRTADVVNSSDAVKYVLLLVAVDSGEEGEEATFRVVQDLEVNSPYDLSRLPVFSTSANWPLTYEFSNFVGSIEHYKRVFNIYTMVAPENSSWASDLRGKSLYKNCLSADGLQDGVDGLVFYKTVNENDIVDGVISGTVDSGILDRDATTYFIVTMAIADDNFNTLTPELIIGGSQYDSSNSAIPIDSNFETASYLVIDYSNLIANSQNSGGTFTLPSVRFNAPKTDDLYLANILIQSPIDIEALGENGGRQLFETVLESCDVQKYAIVAKAEIDERNLKADYESYNVSISGTLHMRFEEAGLDDIEGLSCVPYLSMDYSEFQTNFVGSSLLAAASSDILNEVSVSYSLDGIDYVDTLEEIKEQIEADNDKESVVGTHRVYVKATKEGYADFNRSSLIVIGAHKLRLNDNLDFSSIVPSITQFASNTSIVLDGYVETSWFGNTLIGEHSNPKVKATVVYNYDDVNADDIGVDAEQKDVLVTITFAFDNEADTAGDNDYYLKPEDITEVRGVVRKFVSPLVVDDSDFVMPSFNYGDEIVTDGITLNIKPEVTVTGISSNCPDVEIIATGTFDPATCTVTGLNYSLSGANADHYNISNESTDSVPVNLLGADLVVDPSQFDSDDFAITQFDVDEEGNVASVEFYLKSNAVSGLQYSDALVQEGSFAPEDDSLYIKATAYYTWADSEVPGEPEIDVKLTAVGASGLSMSSAMGKRYNIVQVGENDSTILVTKDTVYKATGKVNPYTKFDLTIADAVYDIIKPVYGQDVISYPIDLAYVTASRNGESFAFTSELFEYKDIAIQATLRWTSNVNGHYYEPGTQVTPTIEFSVSSVEGSDDAKRFNAIPTVTDRVCTVTKGLLEIVLADEGAPSVVAGASGEDAKVDLTVESYSGIVDGEPLFDSIEVKGVYTNTTNVTSSAVSVPVSYEVVFKKNGAEVSSEVKDSILANYAYSITPALFGRVEGQPEEWLFGVIPAPYIGQGGAGWTPSVVPTVSDGLVTMDTAILGSIIQNLKSKVVYSSSFELDDEHYISALDFCSSVPFGYDLEHTYNRVDNGGTVTYYMDGTAVDENAEVGDWGRALFDTGVFASNYDNGAWITGTVRPGYLFVLTNAHRSECGSSRTDLLTNAFDGVSYNTYFGIGDEDSNPLVGLDAVCVENVVVNGKTYSGYLLYSADSNVESVDPGTYRYYCYITNIVSCGKRITVSQEAFANIAPVVYGTSIGDNREIELELDLGSFGELNIVGLDDEDSGDESVINNLGLLALGHYVVADGASYIDSELIDSGTGMEFAPIKFVVDGYRLIDSNGIEHELNSKYSVDRSLSVKSVMVDVAKRKITSATLPTVNNAGDNATIREGAYSSGDEALNVAIIVSSADILSGDSVVITAAGTCTIQQAASAGNGKVINISYVLSGADAAKYEIDTAITPKMAKVEVTAVPIEVVWYAGVINKNDMPNYAYDLQDTSKYSDQFLGELIMNNPAKLTYSENDEHNSMLEVSYWNPDLGFEDYGGHKFVVTNRTSSFLIKANDGSDNECFWNSTSNDIGRHIQFTSGGVRYYAQICGSFCDTENLSPYENDKVTFNSTGN